MLGRDHHMSEAGRPDALPPASTSSCASRAERPLPRFGVPSIARRTLAGALLAAALLAPGAGTFAGAPAPRPPGIAELLARAHAQRWDTLAIGERVARFGLALEGAPYLAGTLEGPGPEVCRITTRGYDCVTFMELCLALARVTRGGARPTEAEVRDAVTLTRYRGGRLAGYVSRLHYTSEWIADAEDKGVLEDVTAALGGVSCSLRVGYMSSHPDRYPALAAEPALVDSMRRIEAAIHRIGRACIPRARVAAIEPRLRTGDLVAIATSIGGLDYAHTGIVVRDGARARLLHASSRHGRVTLDEPLGRWLERAPASMTGVTIARPLRVGGGGR